VVRVNVEAVATTEERTQKCIACQGKGLESDMIGNHRPCGWCNGQGKVKRPARAVYKHVFLVDRP
jgi:DnaJ-class molecular chaperone